MPALPPHHASLLATYGFGLFPLPSYRPVELGDWRVRLHLPSRGDGYLATQALESRAVLTRAGKVWMCTGLLEQESHAWHVHCARGTVVVAGLGSVSIFFLSRSKSKFKCDCVENTPKIF